MKREQEESELLSFLQERYSTFSSYIFPSETREKDEERGEDSSFPSPELITEINEVYHHTCLLKLFEILQNYQPLSLSEALDQLSQIMNEETHRRVLKKVEPIKSSGEEEEGQDSSIGMRERNAEGAKGGGGGEEEEKEDLINIQEIYPILLYYHQFVKKNLETNSSTEHSTTSTTTTITSSSSSSSSSSSFHQRILEMNFQIWKNCLFLASEVMKTLFKQFR